MRGYGLAFAVSWWARQVVCVDAMCVRVTAWVSDECAVMIGRMRRVMASDGCAFKCFDLCVWVTGVIVWTDERRDPAVRRQSEWTCGGCEGSGGAGSSCEPSHGG